MPQINLLKQKPVSSSFSATPIIAKVLVVVVFAMVGYYIWMLMQVKQVTAEVQILQGQISQQQNALLGSKQRETVLARQQQLQIFQTLLSKHVYWSHIFPALAQVTLKRATYSSIQISPDGQIALSVQVPTIDDLDKYLQVFDLPEFNKNFSNVTISGYNNVQNGTATNVQFTVQMQYNPQLLQYQDSATN